MLITGGAGFIGSHIVNALRRDMDVSVFIYDIKANNNKEGNTVSVPGDIFNSDLLTKVMKDHEVSSVVHMIGDPSIPSCQKNPNLSFRLNVLSVQNILEAMRLNDVGHLIFPSTASVYGKINGVKASEDTLPNPTTVYGFHKLAAESLIKGYAEQYSLKPTILRVFNVYGDLDKEQGVISLFIRRAFAHEPLIIKGGKQLRDFVELKDVVQAFVKALTNAKVCENHVINVASGVGLTISAIADMIKQSFPQVEVEYRPSESNEYSFSADVSCMKNLLKINPTDPGKGIPKFIEKCKSRNKYMKNETPANLVKSEIINSSSKQKAM